jgi:branched-chain amino acid aminotransferase
MAGANSRVAYFNGAYVPENEVLIPFRERSFTYGDAVFDVTRTFNKVPFKLDEHIDRLYRSLKYARIDPGFGRDQMIDISRQVVERNLHLLDDGDDYWVAQRVTRGVDAVGDEGWEHTGPTVIVESKPLPLKERARMYRDGIELHISSIRRVAPEALSPRAKTHNYLNLIMADLEVKVDDGVSWTMLLDVNGNLCEAIGSNIFVVRDGALSTPREQFVLPGISRQTVIELAAGLEIDCQEKDLDVFDATTADEVFLTSTAFCIVPVSRVSGVDIGDATVPGPVTRRLLDAYSELVDCDIVAQYLNHLE